MDVFRKEVKENLFFTYLNRIIRFRRDGAIIKWQEILGKK